MRRGLVLAGGGVAGIAWELGVLHGIQQMSPGLRLTDAEVNVGTSAGSSVAAQITSGTELETLYLAQLAQSSSEIEVDVDVEALIGKYTAAMAAATSPQDARRRIGEMALATETVDEATRLRAIEARLPVPTWPEQVVLVPSVDAGTGEQVVFSADSRVRLADAVAASCAVPGVWPPVTINGRRYIDGGMRSGTNADLAIGCEVVLIISPTLPGVATPWGDLAEEIKTLHPARVLVVEANDDSIAAFGTNPLSPATRASSARAGLQIGRAMAAEIAEFWG